MANLTDFTVPGDVANGAISEIDDIVASLRTGVDTTILTGTTGTDGNIVQFNGDGDVVDASTAVSDLLLTTSSIDALSDVDTTTSAPSNGDVLEFDGTNWVPSAATDTRTNVSDNGTEAVTDVSDINFNNLLDVTDDGDDTVTIDVSGDVITVSDSIDRLDDVDTTSTSPSTDDVLKFDGTNWVPQSDTDTRTDVSDGGTTVVSAVSDINFGTNLTVTDDTDGTVTVDASLSASFDWIVVSSATTVSVNDRVLADTSGAAFTVTLPASPSSGNQVLFADIGANWATNNLTVDGNGNDIEGATTFTGNTDQGSFYTIYNGTQWIVRFGTGV